MISLFDGYTSLSSYFTNFVVVLKPLWGRNMESCELCLDQIKGSKQWENY